MTFAKAALLILFILSLITTLLVPKRSLAGYLTGLTLPACDITITSKSPEVNLSVQATSSNIGVYIQTITLSSSKDPQPVFKDSVRNGYSLTNTYTNNGALDDTVYTAITLDDLGNTGTCTLANLRPWIQAVGDVHSNGRINAPGGP